MDKIVYKLLTLEEWADFETTGEFAGAGIDLADGYIHLSTDAQVRETARLHFKTTGELKLVEVLTASLASQIKYEAARDGSLFPHLYDVLSLDDVGRVWHLSRRADGLYDFPDAVGQD